MRFQVQSITQVNRRVFHNPFYNIGCPEGHCKFVLWDSEHEQYLSKWRWNKKRGIAIRGIAFFTKQMAEYLAECHNNFKQGV